MGMRVAVCLTGLCKINPVNLNKVFKIFEYISETTNVSFDFYVQYWNSSNRYFYELSEEIERSPHIIKLPKVENQVYSDIISYIKPKDILGLNFSDIVKHSNLDINTDYVRFENTNVANPYTGPKFIHESVFTTLDDIKNWCSFHISYVDFINQRAQFYALQEIVNIVPKNKYDAILKWRYDLLTHYVQFTDMVFKDLKISDNTMYVPSIVRKMRDKPIEEIKNVLAKNDNYTYSVIDFWMYSNDETFRRLANNLLPFSIQSFENETFKFRTSHPTCAPTEECAFLDKMIVEKMSVRSVGTYDTRVIHPIYSVPDSYFNDPVAELKRMSADATNRYNMKKIKQTFHHGELGSENIPIINGTDAFKLQ
jgi:hypothetical protein